ncbi:MULTISPECIES: hypothetical protein [Xanthomonas]|uniref:hypothetical protein n=1 Tax=Xanthomonas TaxID=338 RepID=UPI000E1F5FC6|nr:MULTISPECIES: hypothetical protein [Xanthomonas]
MAEFPAYVGIMANDFGEEPQASVSRTEMERGLPKQRLLNTRDMVELSCTLLFRSKADMAAFDAWYFDEIKKIGEFAMQHPRTGAQITARIKGGAIGRLQPRNPMFTSATRQTVIEYLR